MPIADVAGVMWPLALSVAAVVVGSARRRRRRKTLNEALHELRRPLQALVLAASAPPPRRALAVGQVEQALSALERVDREVNGRPAATARRRVCALLLASAAVERWREPATALGRAVELRWRAGDGGLRADPEALGRALDNLIANALEHGGGTVLVEGAEQSPGWLRIAVSDSGRDPGAPADPASKLVPGAGEGTGRGVGLGLVRSIAVEHGGGFSLLRGAPGTGAVAVLELPLAR